MRILALGGTQFVGRRFVEAALGAGHELTLFHRGRTNPELFPEAEHVLGDRSTDLGRLAGRHFDAVYDPSGYTPDAVGQSVAQLGYDRYAFISTISAYARPRVPGLTEDAELHEGGDGYGPLKAACERVLPEGALVIRPGVVAGAYDPTNRFEHWVRAKAAGGRFEAPEPPDAPVQLIDARDLAAFTLAQLEAGAGGPFNVTGETTSFAGMLDACAGSGEPDWVPGEERFPLWLPPEFDGAFRVSSDKALQAGLRRRPLAETAEDTRAWLEAVGRLS
jgi:2'-hydroxyisoflavone reductase